MLTKLEHVLSDFYIRIFREIARVPTKETHCTTYKTYIKNLKHRFNLSECTGMVDNYKIDDF